ncbi:MAG TPA: AraC family transcriptional regulator [Defluviitoga tunisiensis]|nr:AraC family transcriptional regulator [Defluviitoga tunisiensis]
MENVVFILDRLFTISQIPTYYLGDSGKIVLYSRAYKPESDPLLCDKDLRYNLINCVQSYDFPVLRYEDDKFVYAVFKDSYDCIAIMGPVCLQNPDSGLILCYARKHFVNPENFYFKHMSIASFCAQVSLLYYCLTGKHITDAEIISQNMEFNSTKDISPTEWDIQEHLMEVEIPRLTYEEELAIFKQISEGNVEKIKEDFNQGTLLEKRVPRLAQNTFKHYEYLVGACITLAVRAAIQGGLDPTLAYAMGDMYKHSLERCQTINELTRLQRSVMIGFASKVRQIEEERIQNSLVEKCKSYILSHLNKPFTLDDIARELNVSKFYLSRLFSKSMGISIGKYTQKKRVETAAYMLKYSNENIPSIASYLCFCSQSHFGAVFKKYMGITPQKYREKEQSPDLISSISSDLTSVFHFNSKSK